MDSPMPSVSTPPTSVASNDSANHNIRFTSMKALLQTINGVSGDFLTVTNFPPGEFIKLVETEKRFRGIRLRRYDSYNRILFITIPTMAHERLHFALYRKFLSKVAQAGLDDDWDDFIATTYRTQGHPGGPRPQREGNSAWPTLVIEAGESESLSELHRDMRWWFSASQHEVKIILLTKLNRSRHAILVQRWEEEAAPPRPGATTTRQAVVLRPVLRQEIEITQNTTTNPVSYYTTRGDLVLPFHLLFLRAPSPQESDIVLTVGDLESCARAIFRAIRD